VVGTKKVFITPQLGSMTRIQEILER